MASEKANLSYVIAVSNRLQAQDVIYSKKCFLYNNGIMDHLYLRVNGDPPIAGHTKEELCNCKWYNRPKYFNGTVDALIKISRSEGVTSLWSGLSPTLALALPTTVIYLSAYEALLKYFRKSLELTKNNEMLVPLLSGMLSRTWAVTVVSPLELVRTKMQSQKMPLTLVKEALTNLVRQEGVLGLWKGYSSTLWRDVPFSAIYWPLYEYLRNHASLVEQQPFLVSFVSGACAGTVASTLTLPMDVIKTRKQIDFGETIMSHKPFKKQSTLSTAAEIIRGQGIGGLYAGLIPRILKVAPACAIMISSYEYCKRFFRQRNQEKPLISS